MAWSPALQQLATTVGVELVKAMLAGKPVAKLVRADVLTTGTATKLAKLEADVAAAGAFGPRPKR